MWARGAVSVTQLLSSTDSVVSTVIYPILKLNVWRLSHLHVHNCALVTVLMYKCSSSTSSEGGRSRADKIGIGVGGSAGVIALVGVGVAAMAMAKKVIR